MSCFRRSISLLRDLGDAHLFLGNFEEADKVYRSIFSLNQGVARVYGRLARLEVLRGNIDTARELAAEEEINWVRELILILALGRRGETEEWRSRLTAYEQEYFELNAYQFAEIYADAGYAEEAFNWLDIAVKAHDPGTSIILVDTFLDSLHGDPRWPKVLAAMGLGD